MALTRPKYSQIYDTDFKQSVRVATTSDVGNLLATGNMTNFVDGMSLGLNDRILVKDQSNGEQNGIYRVSVVGTGNDGTWIRALDADSTGKVTSGMMTTVEEGSVNSNQTFKLATVEPITVGVTSLVFVNPFLGLGSAGNTQVQFNDVGVQRGSANLIFDKTTNTLSITGNILAASISAANVVSAANISGNITTATQTGITTVGNLSLLTVEGTVFVSNSTAALSKTSGAITVTGGLGVSGSVYAETMYGNIGGGSLLSEVYVSTSVLPSANVAYDLGSPTKRWRTGYFSANAIDLGASTIRVTSQGFSFIVAGSSIPTILGADGSITSNVLTANTVTLSSGVTSVSTTTGALVITGGVGVGGNIYAGAEVRIAGKLAATVDDATALSIALG